MGRTMRSAWRRPGPGRPRPRPGPGSGHLPLRVRSAKAGRTPPPRTGRAPPGAPATSLRTDAREGAGPGSEPSCAHLLAGLAGLAGVDRLDRLNRLDRRTGFAEVALLAGPARS